MTFGHFVPFFWHSVTLFFEKCHRVFRCNCKEKSMSVPFVTLFLQLSIRKKLRFVKAFDTQVAHKSGTHTTRMLLHHRSSGSGEDCGGSVHFITDCHISPTTHTHRFFWGVVCSRRSKTWAIIGEKGKIRLFRPPPQTPEGAKTGVINFGISVPG